MKANEIVKICSNRDHCIGCELDKPQACDRFYDQYGLPCKYEDDYEWLEEHGNEVF